MKLSQVNFPINVGKIELIGFKINFLIHNSMEDFKKYHDNFVREKKKEMGLLIDVNQNSEGKIECLSVDNIFICEVSKVERVFDIFNNLDISTELTKELSFNDKQKIVSFLAKYSMRRHTQDFLVDQVNLKRRKGEIGDLFSFFIPYLRKTDKNISNFFSEFQKEYVLFKQVVDAVANKDIEKFKDVFDLHLSNINPATNIQVNERGDKLVYVPHWKTRTLLDWCYLELYETLLRGEKSKACIYCGKIFFSDKSNRLLCDSCRGESKSIYRKNWYEKYKAREQKKARIRMRKNRKKETKIKNL